MNRFQHGIGVSAKEVERALSYNGNVRVRKAGKQPTGVPMRGPALIAQRRLQKRQETYAKQADKSGHTRPGSLNPHKQG